MQASADSGQTAKADVIVAAENLLLHFGEVVDGPAFPGCQGLAEVILLCKFYPAQGVPRAAWATF